MPSSATPSSGGAPLVLFVHIAKTGGTTLRQALLWQYVIYRWKHRLNIERGADDFGAYRALSAAERRRCRIVHGHMRFGIHAHVPGTFQYVTMMREPMRQVISLYHYIKASYTDTQFTTGLRDFILEGHDSYTPNSQVRTLAGVRSDRPDCPDHALETAKRNIEKHIPVVGLTKYFDESLVLMGRRRGWTRWPLYARDNTNSARPPLAQLPDALLAEIREQNALDLALYDYVEARLERQQAEEGASLQDDLRRFRRANAIFGRVAPIGRWVLRQMRLLPSVR